MTVRVRIAGLCLAVGAVGVAGLVPPASAAAVDRGGSVSLVAASPATAAAARWKRCSGTASWNSVPVYTSSGAELGGSVRAVKRMRCKGAAAQLSYALLSSNGRKLSLGNGEVLDHRWQCSRVGSYYDGGIFRCSRNSRKFKAMVGA